MRIVWTGAWGERVPLAQHLAIPYDGRWQCGRRPHRRSVPPEERPRPAAGDKHCRDASGTDLHLPTVACTGDARSFVSLAAQAGVKLLYLTMEHYDPDRLAARLAAEQSGHPDLIAIGEPDPDNSSEDWLRERVREAIAQWDTYQGAVGRIRAVWCIESIAHTWWRETEWHDACCWAAEAVWEEVEHVAEEHRVFRREEDALRLHQLATELAHHPRFPEATSEAKREFMAQQIFSDSLAEAELRFISRRIAQRAQLIYWWEVELVERVAKAERARNLRAQGESIRNIAAVLKMSETKVRAALEEES